MQSGILCKQYEGTVWMLSLTMESEDAWSLDHVREEAVMWFPKMQSRQAPLPHHLDPQLFSI